MAEHYVAKHYVIADCSMTRNAPLLVELDIGRLSRLLLRGSELGHVRAELLNRPRAKRVTGGNEYPAWR